LTPLGLGTTDAFEDSASEPPQRSVSQTLTAFGTAEFEAALIQTVAPQRVTITLDSVVAQLGHKRIWRGSDGDGQRYRVEERSSASKERVPTNISGLSMLVDIPLGQTDHGAHEVKVYREVAGQLLHERLEARDSPLTPTEIVEWIRPIIAAMETIHNAGFFCLRFCPYTVKYVDDGDGVFLQGVEVLYPRDAPLAKLPAIAGYTAPEVYEASVGDPLTGAADVYGIAMTLRRRSTPPIRRRSSRATSILTFRSGSLPSSA
jgi:hypothetical protein